MPKNRFRVLLVLAVVSLSWWPANAAGQTKSPARVAQRGGETKAAQPSTSGQRTAAAPRTASGPATNAQPAPPAAQRLPNGPVAPDAAVAAGPKAPFVLTEAEQKLLDQILVKWEKESDKVKTFKCDFRRFEYSPTFGDPKNRNLKSEGEGTISYKAPDRGEYVVAKSIQYDLNKKVMQPETDNLDHWTCDGQSIYEFDAKKKLVVQRKLPPELQGKAISDGPLPFVFGAKADQLRRRYWMRDITPKEQIGKQIWLEARPKLQRDAANFDQAMVILHESNFMPFAVRITLPGENVRANESEDEAKEGANIAYVFENAQLNNPLAVLDILKPKTPLGWKLVVEKDASEAEPAPAASTAAEPPPPQAKRTATPTKRK